MKPLRELGSCFFIASLFLGSLPLQANLLKNPGFEETASGSESPSSWATSADGSGKAALTDKDVHSGQKAIIIPANTAVEQKVDSVAPGAYLARCWVKSETEQPVTFLVRNPDRPWVSYTCAELRVPKGKWTELEAFCAVDVTGPLTVSLGGMSKEFRLYHGTATEMGSSIIADDFELVRYEPKISGVLNVWDVKNQSDLVPDWPAKRGWSEVKSPGHVFAGTPAVQGGPLAGVVRSSDGGLMVYSTQSGALKQCFVKIG